MDTTRRWLAVGCLGPPVLMIGGAIWFWHLVSVEKWKESVILPTKAKIDDSLNKEGIVGKDGPVYVWDLPNNGESTLVQWEIRRNLAAGRGDSRFTVLFLVDSTSEVVGHFEVGGDALRIRQRIAAVSWPDLKPLGSDVITIDPPREIVLVTSGPNAGQQSGRDFAGNLIPMAEWEARHVAKWIGDHFQVAE